jgi:hypothetical protein
MKHAVAIRAYDLKIGELSAVPFREGGYWPRVVTLREPLAEFPVLRLKIKPATFTF